MATNVHGGLVPDLHHQVERSSISWREIEKGDLAENNGSKNRSRAVIGQKHRHIACNEGYVLALRLIVL